MGIFLFSKQIVDLIYQIKLLDVVMVLIAFGLIVYRVVRNRLFCDIKNNLLLKISVTDYAVLALAVIYGFSFIRDTAALNDFIKIESAFFVYILGRFYFDEIVKHGKMLALAGYLIIYANFIYSVLHQLYKKQTGHYFNWEPFGIDNGGALYYYKTDLAIGIVFAIIFIYAFSQKRIFKWFSIIVVSFLTLAGTKARMGLVMLMLTLLVIAATELAKLSSRKKPKSQEEMIISSKKTQKVVTVLFSVIMGVLVLFFVAVQFSPVKKTDYYGTGVSQELDDKIENIFHSRHVIYWDTMHYISNENVLNQFIGNDLTTFPFHNQRGMMSHSLYVNGLYVVGYLGLILLLFIAFRAFYGICRIEDEKMKFVTFMIWTSYIIFGLTVDSMITTQLSWFPYILCGAVTTMYQKTVKQDISERKNSFNE